MAQTRYNEIDQKGADEEMLEKIRTALKNVALDIATRLVQHEGDPAHADYPTDKELTWARAVLRNATHDAIRAWNLVLMRNKDLANLANLNGVDDAGVQAEVDLVVRYLIAAQVLV